MKRRCAPSTPGLYIAGLFALALAPLVPGAARAQTTPAGAQALEQQLHDWMASTLGPDVDIAKRPIQVTAAGDHYDVAIPVGDQPGAPHWTATARERSGGRWAIDDIMFPTPSEFQLKLPDGMNQGQPNPIATLTYKVNIGKQSGQMLLDPSFASTTSVTSTITNIDIQASGGVVSTSSHIDSGSSSMTIQPAAGGRIDVALDYSLDGYRVDTGIPSADEMKIVLGKTRVTAGMTNISRERGVQALQALIKIVKAVTPPGTVDPSGAAGASDDKPAAPPPPEAVATLIEAFADLATGASMDQTAQDVTVSFGGLSGSLRAAQFGFGVKGVGGLLQAKMDLGAENLTLPELGLGDMVQLIPTKIALHPTVSNVPADALQAMLKSSREGDDPTDGIMALFEKGPIVAGMESMTVALAGAEFTGQGKLTIASPQEFSGTAQITATNLDLLQQRIAAQPSLAQAGPVIILLKGMGRASGNQMVWDVVYQGGRVLVNNQDLNAMLAGPPPPKPQTQQTPPRSPQQNGQPQLRRRQ